MMEVDVFGTKYELDPHELQALLASVFADHEHKPGKDAHRVVFFERMLEATFKSGETYIRSIGPMSAKDQWPAKRLLEAVEKVLVADEHEPAVAHGNVFLWPSDMSLTPHEFRFAMEGDFAIRALDKELNDLGVGFPCQLFATYKKTGFVWLDAYRQQRAVLRARNLMAGLGRRATGYSIADPYESSPQAWSWTSIGHARFGADGPLEEQRETKSAKVNSLVQLGFAFHLETEERITVDQIVATEDYPALQSSIRMFEELDDNKQNRFLNACSWAHRASISRSVTLRALCLITMIESLFPVTGEQRCPNCGQLVYSIGQRFREHLTCIFGEEAARWASELYKIRSLATHSGEWIGYEERPRTAMIVPRHSRQDLSVRALTEQASTLLHEWLQTNTARGSSNADAGHLNTP